MVSKQGDPGTLEIAGLFVVLSRRLASEVVLFVERDAWDESLPAMMLSDRRIDVSSRVDQVGVSISQRNHLLATISDGTAGLLGGREGHGAIPIGSNCGCLRCLR